jgi:hypothetical protein
VVLAVLAQNSAVGIDNDCCDHSVRRMRDWEGPTGRVPDGVLVGLVALQDRRDNDDAVFARILGCMSILDNDRQERPTFCRNRVVRPVSADSANCVQGSFSRVQNAKGIAL